MMNQIAIDFQILSVMVLLALGCVLPVSSQSRTAKADPEFTAFWIKVQSGGGA